jgi:hypothetical protein
MRSSGGGVFQLEEKRSPAWHLSGLVMFALAAVIW